MESVTRKPGELFLKETGLSDSIPVSGMKEPGVCGLCEPSAKIIHLPKISGIVHDPAILYDVIKKRRSVRSYSEENVMRWELSLMLYYTQGVSSMESPHLRTVPSAGSLHPFETYIAINRVEGLQNGIYRYLPLDHALVFEQCHGRSVESVAAACKRPELILRSALTFLWIAVPGRMIWKFGPRGWRYLFIEAGHLCQNLYLIGTALGCGVCAIGSYHDEEMNCALGVDGKEQFCIYLASVGKKA